MLLFNPKLQLTLLITVISSVVSEVYWGNFERLAFSVTF